MTRFKLLLALVATTLSFTAATAQANELEWFSHATICVPATSGATAPTYNQYGVKNISGAAALLVECPLITTLSTSSIHIGQVRVFILDRGATRTTCTLRNVEPDGTLDFSQTATSSGFSFGVQELDFSPSAGNTTNGFWQVECTIPAVNGGNFSSITALKMQAF
jgi:hypothetical protein